MEGLNKPTRRLCTFLLSLACAQCAMLPQPAEAMVYQPRKSGLWDVWAFHDDKTYFLFYDAVSDGALVGMGLATSQDGVHWTEHGTVIDRPQRMGSGYTWRSPNFARDQTFQCNFSGTHDGRQAIFFAESTNLKEWKIRNDILFHQDERWYQREGRWDCIANLPRPGGGYFGYWTANPADGTVGFGFGETIDGVHWTALPAPRIDWGIFSATKPSHCEVGDVKVVKGKYYALINHSLSEGGSRMIQLVANNPEGPFVAARKNTAILEGDCHFARFFDSPHGLLVVQHSLARENLSGSGWTHTYATPMKRAIIDAEGIMRVAWWEGNEAMKGEKMELKPWTGANGLVLQTLQLDPDRGFILEGSIKLPPAGSTDLPGIYLGSAAARKHVIRVTPRGTSQIGTVNADGSDFQLRDPHAVWFGPAEVDREVTFGDRVKFRLLARHGLIEFYLDDILFHIRSLVSLDGAFGLVGPSGTVREVSAWQMSFPPTANSKPPSSTDTRQQ